MYNRQESSDQVWIALIMNRIDVLILYHALTHKLLWYIADAGRASDSVEHMRCMRAMVCLFLDGGPVHEYLRTSHSDQWLQLATHTTGWSWTP